MFWTLHIAYPENSADEVIDKLCWCVTTKMEAAVNIATIFRDKAISITISRMKTKYH